MKPNRLCIYTIFDKDGVVDRYIPYWLDALSAYVAHFVIVCNGFINEEGREILRRYTEDVFERENTGYDADAIKDALENFYGWDKALTYDELLLCNDTFYGPFYPLSEMFGEMENRDADFWGITEHAEYRGDADEFQRHLQSYFINVNSDLLHSPVFLDFWKQLPSSVTKKGAVYNYEILFSAAFQKAGYTYAAYNDAARFYSPMPEYNFNYSKYDAFFLIKECRCPIAKKYAFWNAVGEIPAKGGERSNELMALIESSGYDADMIWENLLRVCHIRDIYESLRLSHILDTKNPEERPPYLQSVLVIAHIHYDDCADECLGYLLPLKGMVDIVVTTSNEGVYSKVLMSGLTVRKIENRGRDAAALLVACADLLPRYAYLCFTHDKRSVGHTASPRAADSFRYLLWENLLASPGYVQNVIHLFSDNPRLGFLSPPHPRHAQYFIQSVDGWCKDFHGMSELMDKLGIHVPLDEGRNPLSTGTAFWCRPKALKTLFSHDWKLSDFPEEPMPTDGALNHFIERCFPFAAQHEGYYSGTVMTSSYAAVRLMGFEENFSEFLLNACLHHGIIDSLSLPYFWRRVDESLMLPAGKDGSKIYVYGAGDYGKHVDRWLTRSGVDYLGFIVSDGQPKQEEYCGHPVLWLSEVALGSDVMIIIALGRRNAQEVMPALKRLPVRLLQY